MLKSHKLLIFFFFTEAMRKDKSLGIMSQRFLMLFLVSKVSTTICTGYYTCISHQFVYLTILFPDASFSFGVCCQSVTW